MREAFRHRHLYEAGSAPFAAQGGSAEPLRAGEAGAAGAARSRAVPPDGELQPGELRTMLDSVSDVVP